MTAILDQLYADQHTRDAQRLAHDPLLDGEPLVEIDGQLMPESQAQQYQDRKRAERLQIFSTTLKRRRDEWVSHRQASGVDRRWSEDLDYYNNRDPGRLPADMMDAVQNGGPVRSVDRAKATRSTVFIGLTRNKTNAASARLADILLPTDDKNWGIKPTPQPHLVAKLKDNTIVLPDGMGNVPMGGPPNPAAQQPAQMQPVAGGIAAAMQPQQQGPATAAQIAADIIRRAKEAAERMSTAIEDQLEECDYNGALRKAINWAAILGTGVVKGPLAANRYRKAWVRDPATNVHMLQMVKETAPISTDVDPRFVYPDPAAGADPHKGAGIFEYSDITEREIRDLQEQDDYIEQALRDVLEAGPKPRLQSTVADTRSREYADQAIANGYQRWEYWGEVSAEDLRACGALPPDAEDDVMIGYSACVVMINDQVVKAYLNPMETQELPYDFFQWEVVADSPWGLGIPRLMNSQQRVLNAAWRMMMDNAAMSAGPQIVVDMNTIEPVDQRWEITGRKLWKTKVSLADIKSAMAVFNVETHQEQFENIIKMAMALADEDTGVPQITQGEKGPSVPDTLGGMQLLMNAANVVLRRLVKRFDDSITRPHIRRYYDFNMEHNADDEIKGDFSVDARGSSALLVRDIQNQALMQLLAAYNNNPLLQAMVKLKELFKKALQAQHIDTEAILYPDSEIDQRLANMQKNMPQPVPVQVAQVNAQARVQVAQISNQPEQQGGMSKEEMFAAEAESKRQIAEIDAEFRIRELELKRELAILEYANKRQVTLDQIKGQLADTAIRERTKKELFVAEAALKTSPENPTHEGI